VCVCVCVCVCLFVFCFCFLFCFSSSSYDHSKFLFEATINVEDCSILDDDIHYHSSIVSLYDRHLCP
jgi:hypothetical protein